MVALDPLGVNPFFSTVAGSAQKKDKNEDPKKVKKQHFATALKEAEALEQSQIIGNAEFSSNIKDKSFDDALQYLIDTVYSAGDKLKKEPYTDEFKNYKKALSQFMAFVVQNSYEVEEHERRRGAKRQIFTLVQVINTKLDELAANILYNQADQLQILAKIEEINGILVDCFS